MTESLMLFLIFSSANSLFAYLGPGMGGGVIAAIFGIIAAFFLGLWGILYYPIKRAFKNKQRGFSFDFDYEDCIEQYLKSIEFISDIKNEKDHKTLSGLILKDCPESINLIKESINNFIEVIDHSIDWIDSNPGENFELYIEQLNRRNERVYGAANSISYEDEKIAPLNADGDSKFELKDYTGAIDDYSEVLKIDPENKEALKKGLKRIKNYLKLT